MSTFLDGVGQCQYIDKSGELVDLKGHDITSLDKTGTFTWEHQAGSPATLVGKILKAKKIFSKEECENDRELRFWNKVKAPYLYVMGELLDDYTASAKECAGHMQYSRDNPDKNPLLGFSIEGSEIPNTRKGMIITRSIARKVTLTQSPCNSMCIAEIYEGPEQKSQVKDDFDEIFKTEENAITLFKSGEGEKIYLDYLAKKEIDFNPKAPKTFGQAPHKNGTKLGSTSTGKDVFSHGHVGEYGFNSAEHKEASEMHRKAAVEAPNPKLADNHIEKMRLHNQAALTSHKKENRLEKTFEPADPKTPGISTVGANVRALNDLKTPEGEKKALQGIKEGMGHIHKPPKEILEDYKKLSSENIKNAHQEQLKRPTGPSGNIPEPKVAIKPGETNTKILAASEKKNGLCDLHKAMEMNRPVFNTIDPKNMRSGLPGMKAGMGTSLMGAHVRNQLNPRSSDKSKEVSKERAMQIATKELRGLRDAPKPNLPKSEQEGDLHKNIEKPISQRSPHEMEPGKMYDIGHKSGHAKYHRSTEAAHHFSLGDRSIKINREPNPDLKKAIEAGSYNAAPSTLTSGAAYQTESLSSKQANTGEDEHNFMGTKKTDWDEKLKKLHARQGKKDWNQQAKEDYENWPHKEKFEKFMQARMPHLALGEIQALGRVLSLKKNIDFEKSLDSLVSLEEK